MNRRFLIALRLFGSAWLDQHFRSHDMPMNDDSVTEEGTISLVCCVSFQMKGMWNRKKCRVIRSSSAEGWGVEYNDDSYISWPNSKSTQSITG